MCDNVRQRVSLKEKRDLREQCNLRALEQRKIFKGIQTMPRMPRVTVRDHSLGLRLRSSARLVSVVSMPRRPEALCLLLLLTCDAASLWSDDLCVMSES